MTKKQKTRYSLIALAVLVALLVVANLVFDSYQLRILNLSGIYVVLALGLNLINGFTGLFSLGHAGFMAIGAYTSVLLSMSPELKAQNFYLKPIAPFLANIQLPFLVALFMGGLVAAAFGFLIGAPVLKLRDDYLAIATLGFGEIIRVVLTNLQSLTNGPLGLKGITRHTNTFWAWGFAILTIILMKYLIDGSYGKAFKAIREDEIAAEAMGIDLFKHKVYSFILGTFLAGLGGGLLAHLMGTIDPLMFRFLMTFNILLIVVLGGIGSITGSVISAVVVTVMMEVLRFIEADISLGFITIPGIPGMRMVLFSILLMAVILFYPRGLMGTNELDWDMITKNKWVRRWREKKGGA
jgi:branched-chain amino acid transport system permease protein